ncbi:MAG: macro domain-containing protein [Pyrinomonadaceae bacterium]|nr:macro domain-containing protein [Pyrinomonadaceae bacterium]
MIEYKKGDMLREDAEALVNTVNCVGIMGRGIALQFKNAFPENFKAYVAACERNEVQPGQMLIFKTGRLTNPKYIINFPTKRHWRGKSRIEDIDAGLVALSNEVRSRNIHSIAIPPLGSGLGGLDWSNVRPRIENSFRGLDNVRVVIFEPAAISDDTRFNHSSDVPKMTAGRAALVLLMDRYLGGLLDPFITLLEVHKLMYFMAQSGEPLRLTFTKGPYGPYAENLRHVLKAVEGHFVSGYADGGDVPDKQLKLVPGAVDDAAAFLESNVETQTRLGKVADLVEGFESPFGLELLATVHWIASQESARSIEDIVKMTYAWNDRKRQFTRRQIALAADVLSQKGWIASVNEPDFA